MNNWIDIQTANIIKEHADDLKNRMEFLSENTNFKALNDIYWEIINDFQEGYYADACLKINLISKMILNNQVNTTHKDFAIELEDINIIIELSLGLQNAVAIQKSQAIQNFIAKDNANE